MAWDWISERPKFATKPALASGGVFDARINLKMDVLSLVNVGAYFDALDVSHGAGPLALDLYMTKGYLGPKSKLSFETEQIRVKGDGFGVATDWHLNFDASGEPGGPPGILSP